MLVANFFHRLTGVVSLTRVYSYFWPDKSEPLTQRRCRTYSLPDELLELIFQTLVHNSLPADLANACLVDRHWAAIGQSVLYKRPLPFRDPRAKLFKQAMLSSKILPSHVRELHFDSNNDFEAICSIILSVDLLRCLRFTRYQSGLPRERELWDNVTRLGELRELSLQGSLLSYPYLHSADECILRLNKLPSLRVFHMFDLEISNSILQSISDLKLDICIINNVQGPLSFFQLFFVSYKEIKVVGFDIACITDTDTDTLFFLLESLPNLRHLRFSGRTMGRSLLNDQLPHHLSALQNLRRLDIKGSPLFPFFVNLPKSLDVLAIWHNDAYGCHDVDDSIDALLLAWEEGYLSEINRLLLTEPHLISKIRESSNVGECSVGEWHKLDTSERFISACPI